MSANYPQFADFTKEPDKMRRNWDGCPQNIPGTLHGQPSQTLQVSLPIASTITLPFMEG
jgi:hypothetical protein